jgi:hypothetical protein
MNTLEASIGKKKEVIHYPSSWNELSQRQLIDICDLFIQKKTENIFRAAVVLIMIGKNTLLFKSWRFYNFMKSKGRNHSMFADVLDGINVSIFRISETLDFLYKKNELTRNLIPKFRGLYGPSDLFGNLTFIEYSKADIRCRSYDNTHDEKYLNELIAVLYRPGKYFWNIRRHFTADSDPRQSYGDRYISNAKRVARWPQAVRRAIYLYYKGCSEALLTRYPHVFTVVENSEQPQNAFGMGGLIASLAGEKFGNPDQTANTMLHYILIHLEQEAIAYEKQKSQTTRTE